MRRSKGWLQILNGLASGIVVVILISVIALFMIPRLLGWQLVVVLSGSMKPTLPVGSVAFVEPRDAASVQVGDILTFRVPEDSSNRSKDKIVQVTHRVVEILPQGQGLGFRTQGDANNGPDGYIVPGRNVVGTVSWHVPYASYLADRLRSRLGFLLLVAVPGMLLIAGEVRTIVREVQAMRARKKLSREIQA